MKRLLLLITICISSISFGQVPSYVPTNGLLAWYPFDGNANDESGNGYNGIVNGATLSTDRNGIPNSAYSFDGINDYILMTGYPTSYTSYTIAVWAEANAINQVTNGIAVQTGIKSGTKYGSYGIRARDQGDRFIGVHRNSASTLQGIDPLIPQDMNVHHYTQTWDGTAVQLYLDGVLVKTVNIASIGIVSSEFCVGAMYETSINHFFNGIIDDVGFWNRALTECEIQDLYNAGVNSIAGVTQTDVTLTADQNNATYQWIDCDNNNAPISGETNQSYTPTVTGNYAVEVTVNGCTSVSECILVDFTGVDELLNPTTKKLVKIVNLLGQEVEYTPNTVLIYQYSDGTSEKVFTIED